MARPRTSDTARARAYRRQYRQRKRDGRCVWCSTRRKSRNFALCSKCREMQRQRLASRYAANRARDACTDCDHLPAGASRCPKCAARRKLIPSRRNDYRRIRERGRRLSRAGP